MARNLKDAYANLDLVEQALSLALLVPRRPPGTIVDTKSFLLDDESIRKVHADLRTAQVELGPVFAELRELLRMESHSIRGLLVNNPAGRPEIERMHDPFVLSVETWGCTPHHVSYQRQLVEMLIALRHALIESMKRMPHEMGGPGPSRVRWERIQDDHIVISFGGFTREITEERLAWLFAEVASDQGAEIAWTELLARRLRYRFEVQHTEEVENLAEASMERYGRDIRKQLDPFGDLWEQNSKGARWRGDAALNA